jgi:uncharacterized protein
MLAAAFSSALWLISGAVFLVIGSYVYVTVIRQIAARRLSATDTEISAPAKTFGWPEAFLASALVLFLLMNIVTSFSHSPVHLSDRDLIANFLFTVFIVLFVAAFLKVRGLELGSLGGFSKVSFRRAVSSGIVLLLAAWPLIILAEAVTQGSFGSGSSRQEIVDLFNSSRTIQERIAIIVLAVVVAPLSEEFIFRFFIYGVLRRYFGITVGLVFNSFLFAAAHTHLPSAAPLFVLGGCFTLAYEWSGSLLVSMTMHALFNSFQLVLLAFPEIFQQ